MWNPFKKAATQLRAKQVTFKVSGMHCTSCAMNIDGALEDTPGVITADTQYAQALVIVLYDEDQVSVEQLVKVITDEGYQVVSIEKQ